MYSRVTLSPMSMMTRCHLMFDIPFTGAKIGPHLYYLETALALLMVDWKSVESSF